MTQINTQKTILLIENDWLLIHAMEMTLKKAGYHVLTASDGEQAIETLSEHSIDLIVLDLIMPKMDGLAFLLWLRLDAKLTIPALVQTSRVKFDTTTMVLEAGADALIYKPVNPLDLIAKVQELEARL